MLKAHLMETLTHGVQKDLLSATSSGIGPSADVKRTAMEASPAHRGGGLPAVPLNKDHCRAQAEPHMENVSLVEEDLSRAF